MRLRRLLPEPGELETDELAGILALGDRASGDRPYVVANMVASADGRATVAGRSGPLGGEADRQLFHALRASVDAVLAGTGTIAVEGYGRLVRDAARRERRAAAGLAPDPLAVIVTRSGDVPWDAPLFAAPEQRVMVYTGEAVEPPEEAAAQLEVVLVADGETTATAVLEDLGARHGVRSVLCEGGPLLLGALLRRKALDELFLTIAPLLAGPGERTVVEGSVLAEAAALGLTWLLECEGALFARYQVRQATAGVTSM
ncbi:MAG: dihydrofolate reductase family protein [Solirubrobacteraceae bacterium]